MIEEFEVNEGKRMALSERQKKLPMRDVIETPLPPITTNSSSRVLEKFDDKEMEEIIGLTTHNESDYYLVKW